jgi:hypothetical protein
MKFFYKLVHKLRIMLKKQSYYKLLTVCSFLMLGMSACNKYNGIVDDNVVVRPYSLYVADTSGTVMLTNDGDTYKVIFPGDGVAPRYLFARDSNLIMVKAAPYISRNEGRQFNPLNGLIVSPDARYSGMALHEANQQRIYFAGMDGSLGIVYSEDNGVTWKSETNYTPTSGWGGTTSEVTSYAQLESGVVFAYDMNSGKTSIKYKSSDPWEGKALNSGINNTGFIAAFRNTLYCLDRAGSGNVRNSIDSSRTWSSTIGIPADPILCAANIENQEFLVGTASHGVYRLSNGQFVPSNNGIDAGSAVYGITYKKRIFKNNASQREIYAATSTGVYKSNDGGLNWIKTLNGSFRALY